MWCWWPSSREQEWKRNQNFKIVIEETVRIEDLKWEDHLSGRGAKRKTYINEYNHLKIFFSLIPIDSISAFSPYNHHRSSLKKRFYSDQFTKGKKFIRWLISIR